MHPLIQKKVPSSTAGVYTTYIKVIKVNGEPSGYYINKLHFIW